ncbi:MAG: 4-hydroxybenzoate octaprenyltransferase [Rhizobiaceae bacterium]|nr:4-hydroxybenzoate octaprenyltransferase [Rhizobiaceae bacterium]
MSEEIGHNSRVADAPSDNWVYRLLPQSIWPMAQMARWDRPIGWQLLLLPCLWSAAMAANAQIAAGETAILSVYQTFIWHCILFTIGAIAMRGAGCTYNDLVDHELDAQVERTRSRPLPAGRISRKNAKLFIIAQLVVGALVLFQFNWFTIFLAMASLVVVAIYPFAKRFTDWPQLFLGLAFSWGALVGWSAVFEEVTWASICLYLAAVFWTIGYDTIYAHQDREDDALIGVRSTARLFAENTKIWLALLYGLTLLLLALAYYLSAMPFVAYITLFFVMGLFIWQIKVLDIDNPDQCLRLFKFNGKVGLVIFAGLAIALVLP